MVTRVEVQQGPTPDFRRIPSPRNREIYSTRMRPYALIAGGLFATGFGIIALANELFPSDDFVIASGQPSGLPEPKKPTDGNKLAEAGSSANVNGLISVEKEGMLPYKDRELSFITWENANIFVDQAALASFPRNLTLQVINPDADYISTLRVENGYAVKEKTENVDEIDRPSGRHFQIPLYSGKDSGVYIRTIVGGGPNDLVEELPEMRIQPQVFEYAGNRPDGLRVISEVNNPRALQEIQTAFEQVRGFYADEEPVMFVRIPDSEYGQSVDSNIEAPTPAKVVEVSGRQLMDGEEYAFVANATFNAYKRIFENAGGRGSSGEVSTAVGELKRRFYDQTMQEMLHKDVELAHTNTPRPGVSLLRYIFDPGTYPQIPAVKEADEEWTYADAAAGFLRIANTDLQILLDRLDEADKPREGDPISQKVAAHFLMYSMYEMLKAINPNEINNVLPYVTEHITKDIFNLDKDGNPTPVHTLQFKMRDIMILEWYEHYFDPIETTPDPACMAGLGSC